MPCPFTFRGLALAMLVAGASSARAGDDCDSPTDAWQSRSAVVAWAQRNGWQVERLKIDDGCYEIKGRDAQGRRFKAEVDPATLRIVRIRLDPGERARERQRGPASHEPQASAARGAAASTPTLPPAPPSEALK